jgi:HEAT repeat protein
MNVSRSDLILAESAGDVSALQHSLEADNPSIRILALGSLDRVRALTEDNIRTALLDPDRDVRCRAIEVSIQRAQIGLRALLGDADDLVVETAAWALGEREDDSPETVAALSSVGTTHEISICREAAIAALGAIGSDAGLPAILSGLEDRAPVRRRAVLALAPFDTPEVAVALERATKDRDRQVRQAAEDLL